MSNKEPQRVTTNHNKVSHSESQGAKVCYNEQECVTKRDKQPQGTTRSYNEPLIKGVSVVRSCEKCKMSKIDFYFSLYYKESIKRGMIRES